MIGWFRGSLKRLRSVVITKHYITSVVPMPPNLGWYLSHLFLVKLVGLVYHWVYYITTLHIVLDFNSSIVKSIHKCTSCTIDHCSRNKKTSSTSSTHPTWRGRRAAAQCLQTHLPEGWTSLPAAGWTSAWSITKHHHFFARASNGFALQGPNVTMSKQKISIGEHTLKLSHSECKTINGIFLHNSTG